MLDWEKLEGLCSSPVGMRYCLLPLSPSFTALALIPYWGLSQFEQPAINSNALQPWVQAGLAVEAPAKDNSGITFQLKWGTKQFNAFLCDLFPRLFAYLGTTDPSFATLPNEPNATGKKRVEHSLPYVLLFKVRKKYSMVDAMHPNVIKYMEVANGHLEDSQKDGSKKNLSFRMKSLFFGMYPPPAILKPLANIPF